MPLKSGNLIHYERPHKLMWQLSKSGQVLMTDLIESESHYHQVCCRIGILEAISFSPGLIVNVESPLRRNVVWDRHNSSVQNRSNGICPLFAGMSDPDRALPRPLWVIACLFRNKDFISSSAVRSKIQQCLILCVGFRLSLKTVFAVCALCL